VFSQTDKFTCETISKINTIIKENHYRPKPIDDSLSVYVFDTFLEIVDKDNDLFLQSEIDYLKKNRLQIDNYILDENCSFLTDFYTTYTQALNRHKLIIDKITKGSFALSSTETIKFSKKKIPHFKSEKELEAHYKKNILFEILKDISEVSQNKDSIMSNFEAISKSSKAKIFESHNCTISNQALSVKDFDGKFLNTFCTYFDPHSAYFSKSDKSSFLSSVSSDNLTFGLFISMSEQDQITVDEVLPGSSAYFSEKINVGDEIQSVKFKSDEYKISCTNLEKIGEIFSSNDYKNADFTLRKKSGEIYTVKLVKKVMKDYQNNVFSYILEKDNVKTGYIKIPSFYSTFEDGKSNISDDVVKEIFKLKEDKVDGLIIDLQNNGGGSMDEAVKLSGLFIDVGPIAIMTNKLGKQEAIKDTNRGTIYSGPMVILINGFSASASEFFTNAMQDYHRAIVVGNQSLGKATMQQILPITDGNEEFVKLTIEKFYRITGKSNQYTGITPDVKIPTLFDKQMPRENSNPTAFKNDSIATTIKYNEFKNIRYKEIIESSNARIKSNASVATYTALNEKINNLYDNDLPSMVLQFDAVYKDINRINLLWKEIKKVIETEYSLTVKNNSVDIEYQQYDDYLKKSNIEKIKAIKSNLHVQEAFNIINDLKIK
jgi:carboxyl-terminal processing protease